jgi:cyclophilin family peptidyl-prolyl cis-trans isomerase
MALRANKPMRTARDLAWNWQLRLAAVLSLAVLCGCSSTGGSAASGESSASPSKAASDCPTAAPTASDAPAILSGASRAVIQTSKGAFTLELYGDQAPIATANFVALARCGFYEGITFHRVIAGFVIQAGDPQTKQNRGAFNELGTGGPGYGFAIETPPPGLTYAKYVVAMANASVPNSNGSQFFIDLADLPQLPPAYTIIGKAVDGTDVIDLIGQVPTNGTPNDTAQNVPLDPVIIQSITVKGR